MSSGSRLLASLCRETSCGPVWTAGRTIAFGREEEAVALFRLPRLTIALDVGGGRREKSESWFGTGDSVISGFSDARDGASLGAIH